MWFLINFPEFHKYTLITNFVSTTQLTQVRTGATTARGLVWSPFTGKEVHWLWEYREILKFALQASSSEQALVRGLTTVAPSIQSPKCVNMYVNNVIFYTRTKYTFVLFTTADSQQTGKNTCDCRPN